MSRSDGRLRATLSSASLEYSSSTAQLAFGGSFDSGSPFIQPQVSTGYAPPTSEFTPLEEGWATSRPTKLTRPHKVARDEHDIPERVGNFTLLSPPVALEFAPKIKIAKWQSKKRGLKVVWANTEGPIINGYQQVVTEIFDDSGRPHTLEHLTYLGSEKYPYKSVLDNLANRMMGEGTNAATATTNTCYTLNSASEEGFLSLLPCYLDHVFFPTLKSSGFITEVYHVSKTGEDSGVVLSEMQGSTTNPQDLMALKVQETLYNEDNANRSETGGLVEALRKLHIEDIREYHDAMYVPQNVTIVVIGGAISPTNLLNTLQEEFEPSLIAHDFDQGPRPRGWVRPFVESKTARNPPKIKRDSVEPIGFPSDDESVGYITTSWIGPDVLDELSNAAFNLLGTYLTDGEDSEMSQRFIEVKDPWCSGLEFSASGQPQILCCDFASVPTAKIDAFPAKFKAALVEIASKPFDMFRMSLLIKLQMQGLYAGVEDGPEAYLSGTILNDAIYGAEDGSDLKNAFADMSRCRTLQRWTAAEWIALLRKWYIDNPSLTVSAKPSKKLVKKVAQATQDRIDSMKRKYGKAGLEHLGDVAAAAQEKNKTPVPPELLLSFKRPSIENIAWTAIETAQSNGVAGGGPRNRLQDYIDQDVDLPLFVHFSQLDDSKFLSVSLCLFPDALPSILAPHLCALLPLYIETFASLPMDRENGASMSYLEVVKEVRAECMSQSIGVGAPTQECVSVSMKIVKEHYPAAIALLRDLIWNSKFDVARLKIAMTKLLQDLPSEKQDGCTVAGAGMNKMIRSSRCLSVQMNLFDRARSLDIINKRLHQEPDAIIEELEALRRGLTDPRGMRVSIRGDILALDNPCRTWLTHFAPIEPFSHRVLIPVVPSIASMNKLGRNPSRKMMLYVLPSIESTYGFFSAKGPKTWQDPDYAPLVVACGIMEATEGFLWNAVRGAGLAYGAEVECSLETGLISFVLFKSPDSYKAWTASQKLFDRIVSGKIEITQIQLDAAKSTYAFGVANAQATKGDAAHQAFYNEVIADRPLNYSQLALKRVERVTIDDVRRVMNKYLVQVFDPAKSIGSVSCGPAKVKDLEKDFEGAGYEVEVVHVK